MPAVARVVVPAVARVIVPAVVVRRVIVPGVRVGGLGGGCVLVRVGRAHEATVYPLGVTCKRFDLPRTRRVRYRERVSEHPVTPSPQASARVSPTDARSRVTGVIVVGMSVAVWWPAFTLGAWGDLFFDQMLTVWAAATGALIVVLIQPRGKPRLWRALALSVPSVWLVLWFVIEDESEDLATVIISALGIIIALLAVPTTIWVLARTIWPEFAEDISWPRRLVVIGAVLLIAAASFLLGVNQASFLTCGDFTISGNSEPPGCTPDESTSGTE